MVIVLDSAGLEDYKMQKCNKPVCFLLHNTFHTPSPLSDTFKSIFSILYYFSSRNLKYFIQNIHANKKDCFKKMKFSSIPH